MSLPNSSIKTYPNGENRPTASKESTNTPIRFLVCSRDAGAIIGKRGSNIQGLRLKHRTMIQVPDCNGPERVLCVQGDYDRSLAAIFDILPLMKDSQRMLNDQNEIRLLVHQSQAGAVIGKGGERVRELRTKYNVGMKVFVQCLPFSTERVAALRGRSEDIERCLREIFEILDKTPARGQTHFYDPINFDPTIAHEYGGFADGTNVNNTTSPTVGRPPQKRPEIHRPRVKLNIEPGEDDHPEAAKKETRQVTIPNKFVDAIIGVHGKNIAEIRRLSRAKVSISDFVKDSDERIITMEGTIEQIDDAQQRLQMAVKQSGLWNGN